MAIGSGNAGKSWSGGTRFSQKIKAWSRIAFPNLVGIGLPKYPVYFEGNCLRNIPDILENYFQKI